MPKYDVRETASTFGCEGIRILAASNDPFGPGSAGPLVGPPFSRVHIIISLAVQTPGASHSQQKRQSEIVVIKTPKNETRANVMEKRLLSLDPGETEGVCD